jgi:hypothetical protein
MQTTEQLMANPFSLMLNPAEVFEALERSDRLSRLQRRVCRPLDKPLIAKKGADVDANDYDEAIDAEPLVEVESDFGDLSDIITTHGKL